MLIKPAVLCRKERIHKVIRHFFNRDRTAILHKNTPEFFAVAIQDPARNLDIFQLRKIKRLSKIVPGFQVKVGTHRTDQSHDETENRKKPEYPKPEKKAAAFFCALDLSIV